MLKIESCRDCANFEDRRDLENVAICAMHHGPSVSCPEFKPKEKEIDENKLYNKFCLDCANFENVDLCQRPQTGNCLQRIPQKQSRLKNLYFSRNSDYIKSAVFHKKI